MGRNNGAPRGKSKNQQRKWYNAQARDMAAAAENGQARFDAYGGNYLLVTFRDLARNIPGFGSLGRLELSERRSKYYRTTQTGWTVVLDLSTRYFRVINPEGAYTDANGDTKPRSMSDDDFMAISHFRVT